MISAWYVDLNRSYQEHYKAQVDLESCIVHIKTLTTIKNLFVNVLSVKVSLKEKYQPKKTNQSIMPHQRPA